MKILQKEILVKTKNTRIIKLEVYSPYIASKAKPGQFVILMVNERGERIPLTVVEKKKEKIVLIFQETGFTTHLLGSLKEGDCLYSLAGPLGTPTEIKNYGKIILVGGGIGIAELYPVAQAFKKLRNNITTLLGVRTKDMLILEDEMRKVSHRVYITTDDGSYGEKGLVTDILERLLIRERFDFVYCVGPILMMRRVSAITKRFKIKTVVSLNSLMVDATGMCGCCRITVGGEVKFSCVDGPEFDGHLVDWEELEKRSKIYIEKEGRICKKYRNKAL
jgi:ferredoxin--NADP+ reductase